MFDQDEQIEDGGVGGKEIDDDNAMQGDGLHHHSIDEDEGGGYHSVHTHPDGRKEPDDHVSYEDAKDKMDRDFGHGEAEEEGMNGADEMRTDDIAGSYGRAADCG